MTPHHNVRFRTRGYGLEWYCSDCSWVLVVRDQRGEWVTGWATALMAHASLPLEETR